MQQITDKRNQSKIEKSGALSQVTISLSIRPSYGARGEEILDEEILDPFFASIVPLCPRNA